MILGRLASNVAKLALDGENVDIINAEKVIITGSKTQMIQKYRDMRQKGSKERGPFFPKNADRILKRTIRGMVPYNKSRGREAIKRVRTFIGVPEGLEGDPFRIEDAAIGRLGRKKYITLGEISLSIGGKI